jgi:DNA modification methylase
MMMLQPEQLSLELDIDDPGTGDPNDASYFSDPSFTTNKSLPIHRWVPWIAGFASHFVREVLETFLDKPGTVLDPFAGVGTTLVEATLGGHQAIGFEINPYAALACRAKACAYRISVEALHAEITRLRRFYTEKTANRYIPTSQPPQGFRTRSAFYSPQVLRKVLIVRDFIAAMAHDGVDSDLRDLFRLAFAATMVRYSNYSYEPSLGRRVSAGKSEIHDFPVGQTIVRKLLEMAEDITWVQQQIPTPPQPAQVHNTSFFEHGNYIAPASVDLVITSPPYLNNYHYNRNTRPQLYWLGYAERPKDLKPLEHANFGKYWQTVRGKDHVALTFSLPGSDLEARLKTLRGVNPEKGVYGGNGWANYAAAYFNDCYILSQALKRVLKPQGTAVVVIGNSILQGIMIPTDRYLGEIAASIGLELVRIDIPRTARVGNSIIQSEVRVTKAKKSHHLYEAVVELRNPA